MELTTKKAVAGGRVVHALMGGGPAFIKHYGRPMYLKGQTWCGVERRSQIVMPETDDPVTCRSCLRLMRGR